MAVKLPSGFEDLQPFADKWALPTEYERAASRRSATPDELGAFYDASVARLPEIIERVDAYPLGQLAEADRPLFYIALSLAEVAPHVELYKSDPNVPFAFQEDRMFGTRTAAKPIEFGPPASRPARWREPGRGTRAPAGGRWRQRADSANRRWIRHVQASPNRHGSQADRYDHALPDLGGSRWGRLARRPAWVRAAGCLSGGFGLFCRQ